MASQLAGMASLLQNLRVPDNVNPVLLHLPPPPALQGPLAPNNWLAKASLLAQNRIRGPESMVVANGYVYTGLSDGWVVEVNPTGNVRRILRMSLATCERPNAREDACGRPLGVRVDSKNYLIVADAYNGIFRIHPLNGRYQQLVDARNNYVNGKPLGSINDLVVMKDGTIFFTSSSSKWTRPSDYLKIILEGEKTGRVLVYNPRETLPQKRVQELVTNIHLPNGLELSPNEDFLLIAEGGRSRIYRAWIASNSPKKGTIETFVNNLPGCVDNIRRSPRNTYWVGLSFARHSLRPSVLDIYGNQPRVRGGLIGLDQNRLMSQFNKHGIVVELDANGNVIRSLQDVDSILYNSVSEVQEENGVLYIGSNDKNFVGKLLLKMLPPPIQIPSNGTVNSGKLGGLKVTTTAITPTTTHRATSLVNATNPFAVLVETIRSMLKRMTPDQVRDIAVLQVQRLLVLLYEALKERERAVRAENNVAKLQALLLDQTRNTNQAVSTTVMPSGGSVTSSGEVIKATMAALSRTTNGSNVSATTAPATVSVIAVDRTTTPGSVAASSSTAVGPTTTAGQSTEAGPTEIVRPPTTASPTETVRPPTTASPTETAGPSTVAGSPATARQPNPIGPFTASPSTAASVTSSIRPASASSVHRTTDSVESTSGAVVGDTSTAALSITETTAGKKVTSHAE